MPVASDRAVLSTLFREAHLSKQRRLFIFLVCLPASCCMESSADSARKAAVIHGAHAAAESARGFEICWSRPIEHAAADQGLFEPSQSLGVHDLLSQQMNQCVNEVPSAENIQTKLSQSCLGATR